MFMSRSCCLRRSCAVQSSNVQACQVIIIIPQPKSQRPLQNLATFGHLSIWAHTNRSLTRAINKARTVLDRLQAQRIATANID